MALMMFFGLFLGVQLDNPSSKTEIRAQLVEARAQGARDAVASLNTDLMSIVRKSLGQDSVWRSFDEGLVQLNRAADLVKPVATSNPAAQLALQSIGEAQATLRRAREDRRIAEEMIRQIELQTGRSPGVNETLALDLAAHRKALGGLYAELAQDAARSGDKDRATRLLTIAASIDPGDYAAYQKQLESFDPGGNLPRPPAASEGGKDNSATVKPEQSEQSPSQRDAPQNKPER